MAFATRPLFWIDPDVLPELEEWGWTQAELHDVKTAEQFFAQAHRLPRTAQLIDGELVIPTGPNIRHQHIAGELFFLLKLWIQAKSGRGQCGLEVSTKIDDNNVYKPDLWWYREDRKPGITDEWLYVVPDLVVEVLSPSTRRFDLGRKRERYEERGVGELWIIDPKRRAASQYRRSIPSHSTFDGTVEIGTNGRLTSPLLPDFGVRLSDLLG